MYRVNEQTVRDRGRIAADIIDKARAVLSTTAGKTASQAIEILNLDRGELASYFEFAFAQGEHEMSKASCKNGGFLGQRRHEVHYQWLSGTGYS